MTLTDRIFYADWMEYNEASGARGALLVWLDKDRRRHGDEEPVASVRGGCAYDRLLLQKMTRHAACVTTSKMAVFALIR